jgi:hypothetical protein
MPALGHKQTVGIVQMTSALPLKADGERPVRHFSFGAKSRR